MTMRVEQNVPLAGRCTLAVGGEAEHLVCARSEAEVGEALWWAKRRGLPVHVLGGGSNSLIADGGLPGLTIQPKILGKTLSETDDEVLLEVGAGAPWDGLVAFTVEEGLCGIEALSGIPGWAGAAPIQNIGAYGQEVGQTLRAVRLLRRDRGRADWIDASELDLGYRSSKLRGAWRDQFVGESGESSGEGGFARTCKLVSKSLMAVNLRPLPGQQLPGRLQGLADLGCVLAAAAGLLGLAAALAADDRGDGLDDVAGADGAGQ